MNKEPDKDLVIIRTMELSDLEAVYTIDSLSFPVPWPHHAYLYELREKDIARLFVAELINPIGENQVAGMMVVWLVIDEVHIATLATHPDFRRQGIARKLVTRGLINALQEGARGASLEVRERNTAARALYQTFGFEVVGRRRRYYQDNQEDALIMNLSETSLYRWYEMHRGIGDRHLVALTLIPPETRERPF